MSSDDQSGRDLMAYLYWDRKSLRDWECEQEGGLYKKKHTSSVTMWGKGSHRHVQTSDDSHVNHLLPCRKFGKIRKGGTDHHSKQGRTTHDKVPRGCRRELTSRSTRRRGSVSSLFPQCVAGGSVVLRWMWLGTPILATSSVTTRDQKVWQWTQAKNPGGCLTVDPHGLEEHSLLLRLDWLGVTICFTPTPPKK
jgi:hypothetical protein